MLSKASHDACFAIIAATPLPTILLCKYVPGQGRQATRKKPMHRQHGKSMFSISSCIIYL